MEKDKESHVLDFSRIDGIRFEEKLQLPHLQQLMYWFHTHQPPPPRPESGHGSKFFIPLPVNRKLFRQPGLMTAQEFKDTLAKVFGTNSFDNQLDSLFNKLDTSGDGYVDWNEFCTYMLLQFRENDYMRTSKQIPFQTEAKIRHVAHNRQESTAKILSLENPSKYITISKEGAISVWDTGLHVEKTYSLTEGEDEPRGVTAPVSRRTVREWVTDAVCLINCHRIAIASTGRDIRFFDTTTASQYYLEIYLFGLSDVPNCLDYWYDRENPGNPSKLFFGDDSGAIHILCFAKPQTQLFANAHKKEEGLQEIYFQDLDQHRNWTTHIRIEFPNQTNPIRRVFYLPDNDSIVASNSGTRNSIAILDLQMKRKAYVFSLTKGVECFDYNKNLNVLVTGSSDHIVRVWNPYVTSKPVAVLVGHGMAIVDLKVYEPLGEVFSYSRDAVLKVWDIKEQTCIQTITLKFPGSLLGRLPEFGPFSMHLHNNPRVLLVAASDHIACLKLGQVKQLTHIRPTTHSTQLCCAIYNPALKQVVTGADDSTVAFWDLETGLKSMVFSNAHAGEEITCMTLDANGRRLLTGARNGSIKIWNVQNGHNLHQLEAVDDAEVTGMLALDERRLVLAVGWSRKIVQYHVVDPDNMFVKADAGWKSGQIHQEDILALAFCPPSMIATASFDGELCVWSLETESLYRKLRKAQPQRHNAGLFSRPNTAVRSVMSAASGRSTATPNSRPNSRHRRSHRPAPGQPAPVDKLLFLLGRAKVKMSEAAILVSSEAGVLRWWSIFGQKHEIGYFYAPDQADESVLGLCSNANNSILVSGDTVGRIVVWSILDYCIEQSEHRVRHRPAVEHSWTAHQSAVVSVELVSHVQGLFVLSASTDATAALWTLDGQPVGTFGQRASWDIADRTTWLQVPEDTSISFEEFLRNTAADRPVDTVDKNNNKDVPVGAERVDVNDVTDKSRLDSRMANVPTPKPSVPVLPVVPCVSSSLPTVSRQQQQQQLPDRSLTFVYGSDGPKSRLGSKVNQHLVRMTHDRQERRSHLLDVDYSQTSRLGSLCCPYQSVPIPVIHDIELPRNLPVTTRMLQRGYTSNNLTVHDVYNMDLRYYDNPADEQRSRKRTAQRLPLIAARKGSSLSSGRKSTSPSGDSQSGTIQKSSSTSGGSMIGSPQRKSTGSVSSSESTRFPEYTRMPIEQIPEYAVIST